MEKATTTNNEKPTSKSNKKEEWAKIFTCMNKKKRSKNMNGDIIFDSKKSRTPTTPKKKKRETCKQCSTYPIKFKNGLCDWCYTPENDDLTTNDISKRLYCSFCLTNMNDQSIENWKTHCKLNNDLNILYTKGEHDREYLKLCLSCFKKCNNFL